MIIAVTGALGCIGSCLIKEINSAYPKANIIAVDDFYKEKKEINLQGKQIREWIHRDLFLAWFEKRSKFVDCVFHLGARTDTMSKDKDVFKKLNIDFTKRIIDIAAASETKIIYASSAATYGNGSQGFSDDHKLMNSLKPLNMYAKSKHTIDKYMLKKKLKNCYGLKFFNVYGPNEYHKGKMASIVYHAYEQIRTTGKLQLFKSHNKNYKNGEQKRDFIHVNDVIHAMLYLYENDVVSGIYNVGTGKATTYNSLAKQVFKSMNVPVNIEYIDTPMIIRKNYQYETKADISKLKKVGYKRKPISIQDGIHDYISNYLSTKTYY